MAIQRHLRRISRRSTPKFIFLILILLVPICIFQIFTDRQKLTYFFLPLWDNTPPPFKHVPHYYGENVSMDNLCCVHGWSLRTKPHHVFDATIFSNEVDILELCWPELHPYVTKFVIIEGETTFTGIPNLFTLP
ncbi:hypothetical protein LguiB_013841 [Lonicera macranthoides]